MAHVETIAKYRIRELIRRGGMGALYLAYDPELEREVAIKVIRDDAADPTVQERFSREARAVARLRHPNIVTIFDYGISDGRQYIVMEYIPGETFAELIRRRAVVSLERKLELMEGVCTGLAHAHAAGIVHRDIKPANLMIDVDGTVKILDFGIARTGAATLTAKGDLVGTLNYMAPEQFTTGRVDVRSDVFAVGAVLYELVAYEPAFSGDLTDGVAARIVHSEPRDLSTVCSDVSPALSRAVAKALHKRPEARYQDLTVLKNDLASMRQQRRTDQEARAAASSHERGPHHDLTLRSGETTIAAWRMRDRRGHGGRTGAWVAAVAAAAFAMAGGMAWLSRPPVTPPGDLPIPAAPPSTVSPVPVDSATVTATPITEPPAPSASTESTAGSSSSPGRANQAPRGAPSGGTRPRRDAAVNEASRDVQATPSAQSPAVDGRSRPLEPLPLPRDPGREQPQPAVPSNPTAAAPTSGAPPAITPAEAERAHQDQVRTVVNAYVKALSSSTQQVELQAPRSSDWRRITARRPRRARFATEISSGPVRPSTAPWCFN